MRGETLRMWYNKFFNYMKRRKTNAILSLLSKGNISFGIFKDIAEISDTIKFESIIHGMGSSLNEEKCINELKDYVKSNGENAGTVGQAIKNALLSNSPNACVLMGRMIAEHREKSTYDREDIIVAHALSTATDEDFPSFRHMMNEYNNTKKLVFTDQSTADWCLANRLFKQLPFRIVKGEVIKASDFEPVFEPTKAAERLLFYIEETKQLFREKLI